MFDITLDLYLTTKNPMVSGVMIYDEVDHAIKTGMVEWYRPDLSPDMFHRTSCRNTIKLLGDKPCPVLYSLIERCNSAIFTYEDIELRRIFPSEFPQDTIRKSGSLDPEHLGRYNELKNYFKFPKAKVNSHFEELLCYDKDGRKLCRIDMDRYSPEEDAYYLSPIFHSHVDRRRVFCFMLLCFTEDELDRVVASF